MTQSIKDVIQNTKDILLSDAALNTLLDIERVISELDVYAFANWKQGELVEGPVNEKYFVTTTWMWPYKKMPDPRGGERLLGYECEISYKKSHVSFPIKVKDQSDFKTGTRMPKTGKSAIWLVTIVMPRDLINEIHQGSLELENDEIDMQEVENAYQDGEGEDDLKNTDTTNNEAMDAGTIAASEDQGL